MSDPTFDDLLEAMKEAVGVLREGGVSFALAGSLAAWSYGGPDTDHDVDFFLTEEGAAEALRLLEEAGFEGERPAEGWLYKAYHRNGAMIDLIFEPSSGAIEEDILARAEEREAYAVRMPVLSVDDLMATKLLSLKEHNADYESSIEVARALREQIDWEHVREMTEHSPYAKAFFTLAAELDLIPEQATVR